MQGMDTIQDHTCLRKSRIDEEQVTKEAFHDELFSERKKGRTILCKQCMHRITSIDYIIAVNGSHQHFFTNPAGYPYEISCFSSAAGCKIDVMSTFEYTWFRGYCWSLAFCSQCSLHLGWFYQSHEDNFFGLILNRLQNDDTTH